MEQIANIVGIKAPSLYKHYKGKEDILNALIDSAEARYEEMFGSENNIGKVPQSWEEFIKVTMERISFTMRDPIIRKIRMLEDEYYIRIDHSMTKDHYISFVAAVSSGDMQMVKLYPEGSAEARFKIRGVRRIFFYCNRDGLFSVEPVKGVDDKESAYDDSQERRELEKAADMLFV